LCELLEEILGKELIENAASAQAIVSTADCGVPACITPIERLL
jgi:hypothetical protein